MVALGPRLDLRQGQSLAMTPQLQQAIRLLALPNLEIESFLAEALASNPLLEVVAGPDAGEEGDATERQEAQREAGAPEIGSAYAGQRSPRSGEGATAALDSIAEKAVSLADHLHAQIGASVRDPRLLGIAGWLIDQLDEAGYLTLSVDETAADLGVPTHDVEQALALVQALEPTGVGARSLGECLALQAREADRYDPCMALLLEHLDLLARGDFARLRRVCGVDDEDLAGMIAELRGYDPRPGLRFGHGPVESVAPDILVAALPGGGWHIALNPATLPRMALNRAYYLELRAGCPDKAARGWLGEKLADAKGLLKALDQRQKTILKVAAEIVRHQDGFFRHGVAALRPLTLHEVAEAVGLHESTVSRVTSHKYLGCARGTIALKSFFSSAVASTQGEEPVSAAAVKSAIRALVEAEDSRAVLSDDALVERLRGQGFDLARRTVAKYREAIGIGSSVQRRRRKALAAAR